VPRSLSTERHGAGTARPKSQLYPEALNFAPVSRTLVGGGVHALVKVRGMEVN
jgi:hypothetical protein